MKKKITISIIVLQLLLGLFALNSRATKLFLTSDVILGKMAPNKRKIVYKKKSSQCYSDEFSNKKGKKVEKEPAKKEVAGQVDKSAFGDLVPYLETKAYVIDSAKAYTFETGAVRAVTDYRVKVKNYEGPKLAFLTFDDGPGALTPKVLDMLKNEGVHATFFVVGQYISPEAKDTLSRIYNEGHSIAIHSFNHSYKMLYPNRVADKNEIKKQAEDTVAQLKSVLSPDYRATTWRYPGGHMSWSNMNYADQSLREMGIEWIDWNASVGDGMPKSQAPKTVDAMLEYFISTVRASHNEGCIVILMHDSNPKELTLKTLPHITKWLKEQGYSFGILG